MQINVQNEVHLTLKYIYIYIIKKDKKNYYHYTKTTTKKM